MREVDRVAIEETGPNLFQRMENAGRGLAVTALEMLDDLGDGPVVVLAGTGGNGGGGITAGRHLANRDVDVLVTVSDPTSLGEVPAFIRLSSGPDLIGTIHGDVDRVLRQLVSRDPRLAALSRRDVRGRGTYHVRQPTVAETDPQLLDEIPGRGAAAQANGHPAFDEVGGRYSSDPFLLFTAE
jgi:hypothetical protein